MGQTPAEIIRGHQQWSDDKNMTTPLEWRNLGDPDELPKDSSRAGLVVKNFSRAGMARSQGNDRVLTERR
jgi:hypothetical protein